MSLDFLELMCKHGMQCIKKLTSIHFHSKYTQSVAKDMQYFKIFKNYNKEKGTKLALTFLSNWKSFVYLFMQLFAYLHVLTYVIY